MTSRAATGQDGDAGPAALAGDRVDVRPLLDHALLDLDLLQAIAPA